MIMVAFMTWSVWTLIMFIVPALLLSIQMIISTTLNLPHCYERCFRSLNKIILTFSSLSRLPDMLKEEDLSVCSNRFPWRRGVPTRTGPTTGSRARTTPSGTWASSTRQSLSETGDLTEEHCPGAGLDAASTFTNATSSSTLANTEPRPGITSSQVWRTWSRSKELSTLHNHLIPKRL